MDVSGTAKNSSDVDRCTNTHENDADVSLVIIIKSKSDRISR